VKALVLKIENGCNDVTPDAGIGKSGAALFGSADCGATHPVSH
jgi:hypothetical protein